MSISERLKEQQKLRLEQESLISRAARNVLTGTPARNKASEIGRKNYSSNFSDDEDESPLNGADESYEIPLYKNIDFNRSQQSDSLLDTNPKKASDNSIQLSSPKVAASIKSDALNSLRSELTSEWTNASSKTSKQNNMNPLANESPTLLGSVTKGTKYNPNIIASVLEDDYGTAQQISDLKKELNRIHREKEEAELKSKAEIEAEKNNIQTEVQRQQQELKDMIETLKREKEEMALRTALLEAEKELKREEEEKRAANDLNRLYEALDVMRSQNAMLANKMEQSQLEAKEMLERERFERLNAVRKMELENQKLTSQLVESQMTAEKQLATEKEELRNTMRRMEQEKTELHNRILVTEELSKKEAAQLEAQTLEFIGKVNAMEAEKNALRLLVEENENKAKQATAAVAEQLSRERDELRMRMENMEIEKSQLADGLASTEAMAKQHAADLANQLASEKAELRESLERMEREKIELALHLKLSEAAAKEQAAALADQIAREKELLKLDLERMESEKVELANRLALNEEQIKESSQVKSEQLTKEHEELQRMLKQMADEKAELNAKLKQADEQALAREKESMERIAKERDELKQAVQKMKEELDKEREMKKQDPKKDSKDYLNVSPKTSLYELLEEESGDRALELNSKDMVPHTIDTIKEEEEVNTNKSESEKINEELVGLPAPHIAAAMGEMERLKSYGDLERSLLSSFDSDHRTPLFYASAYGRAPAVSFLVELNPDIILEPDVNGDTALHAATSSGSIECIELILKKKKAAVHSPNSIGMTPAHLARTCECLRILYRHGADLTLLDSNGRSPLFVACAMNRSDCAEYLIDCLDQDETSLTTKDARGDTPLHACACNGSVDCLLVLLQHGVDPMLTNTKGLKPIDLAVRNKQLKCQQLLAEYQLHFCTSSQFDSVLFLATLEGHRKVKSTVRSTGAEQYEIIKRNGAQSANSMKKIKSMYSLNHNRSLRLQRWGSWIAYEDQEDPTKTYWYNQRTGEGQWEKPQKVTALQEQQQKALENDGVDSLALNILPKKASMRLKRVGDWIQYLTETGQTFYYNEKNGEFQWVNPEDQKSSSQSQQSKSSSSSANLSSIKTSSNEEESTNPDTTFDMKEWKPFKDPESGAIFWYNSITQVSQWECPFDTGLEELKAEDNMEEDDAVEIHDSEDLGI